MLDCLQKLFMYVVRLVNTIFEWFKIDFVGCYTCLNVLVSLLDFVLNPFQITAMLATHISQAKEIFDQKVKDKIIDLERIENEIKQTHQDI